MNTTDSATDCANDGWHIYKPWKVVLWSMVFGIESIAIFVVNSLVLLVFLKRALLVKKATYFLINLTIADFMVGITAFLFIPVLIFRSKYLQAFHTLSFPIPLLGSLFFMTAIAVERAYATFKPFRHRFLSKKKYFSIIAFIWCLIIIISAFIFVVFGLRVWRSSAIRKTDDALKTLSVLFIGISLSGICISYLSLWLKIRFFKTLNFQNVRTVQENNRLAKTLFIVTIISLLTWLPIILSLRRETDTCEDRASRIASFAVLFLNSIINFVVYFIRIREFKNGLKSVLRRSFGMNINRSTRNPALRPNNRVEHAL